MRGAWRRIWLEFLYLAQDLLCIGAQYSINYIAEKNMEALKASLKPIASLFALGLVLGLSVSGSARADFISCVGENYDISGKVSTATACTILGPLDGAQNDNPLPGFVNGESFFGISDWLFDGKWNNTDLGFVDTSGLFDFTGGGPSGAFSYVGGTGISDIMFVFKDGAGTNLVGYMLTRADGTYDTPFTNPPFPLSGNSTMKNVSHISVYYREGGTPPFQIPEPGMLLLMGAGLMGLGLARRRKSA